MKKNRTIVILIGTDGSGKTSLARQVQQSLGQSVHYAYFGLRDFKGKFVRFWIGQFGESGFIFRLLILPVVYINRFRVLPKSGLILIDRVPGWAFSGHGRRLFFFYRWILPRADVLVLCTGDPDKIYRRKPERTLESLISDIAKWKEVAARYPANQKIFLDTTSQTVADCISKLKECILC